MKRLTAYVSGKIQKVGYRARIVDMARVLGLKGTVQNLEDGRVKVIAEGEENDLERFLKAIDIKNTVIHVSAISKEYSEATGDFESFYKLVEPGETDSRLDQGIEILKEILAATKDINTNLGGKMDQMLEKQDKMLDKQDAGLGKLDDVRADVVGEIRELRQDFKEGELVRVKNDIAEIKAKLGL